MTVKSGFFSDGSSYNQADFNAFLLDSIGSGYVLGYENELEVSENSPANMGVFVKTGRCYVQGYYGWVTSNEALTVPPANSTYPRIDRVVARLSVSVNQSVTFAVLTGTPAASPSAPTLTRTSETYEISLARIAVGAGVTSITAANITDERGDATVCGYSTSRGYHGFPGEIQISATTIIPPWKLLCDGATYNTAQYPDLFAAIGYTFGGSGATFNVPNLKGKTVVGLNSSETEFDTLGESGGEKKHVLTTGELATHTHTGSAASAGEHTHTGNWANLTGTNGTPGSSYKLCSDISGGTTSSDGEHNHTLSLDSVGSNTAHNNLQPYMTLYYVIQT